MEPDSKILYVKMHGYQRKDGRDFHPGSVIGLDEESAKWFVKMGIGEFHPGPEYQAPPPDPSGAGASVVPK
jgi:hypothetical protein